MNTENQVKPFKYTPEYAEQVKEYNSNILNLDVRFEKIIPLQFIIVRCYINEPTITESGLVIPHKEVYEVQTKSGVGSAREYETDWPYSYKAVVVAVPAGMTSIKRGEIVQLSRNAVQVRIIGKEPNVMPVVVNGFTHIDSKNDVPPKDVTDPDYGYILIPVSEIIAKYA